MAVPGPYSGVSTLAFVARASAFTFGVVYGSIKLSYLRLEKKMSLGTTVSTGCSRVFSAAQFIPDQPNGTNVVGFGLAQLGEYLGLLNELATRNSLEDAV